MIKYNRKQNCLYILAMLFTFLINNSVFSQIGLSSKLFEISDSTKAKNTVKWLNLKEWNNYNQANLSLKSYNSNDNFDKNRYHPSNVMPKSYFDLDYRSSSYYVPRMVKDELNLIMNRPKDSALMPIMGVAYIAAQLASKYIFVQEKLKISTENVLNSIEGYEILKTLWKKSPQTSSQLYKFHVLQENFSLNELNMSINNLIDNKLIKQKNVEDKEMLFFPAISISEYEQILQRVLADTLISKSNKMKIKMMTGK